MGKYFDNINWDWYEKVSSFVEKKVWVYFDIDKEETGKVVDSIMKTGELWGCICDHMESRDDGLFAVRVIASCKGEEVYEKFMKRLKEAYDNWEIIAYDG